MSIRTSEPLPWQCPACEERVERGKIHACKVHERFPECPAWADGRHLYVLATDDPFMAMTVTFGGGTLSNRHATHKECACGAKVARTQRPESIAELAKRT